MARPIWSGAISFGLVHVPVKLVSAVKSEGLRLHMLSEDGTCRLRRKLYCPETGEEYDFSQTARGYEIAPGQYVLLDQKELEALKAESGRTIRIEQFVDAATIDPVFYDRPYYLLPGEAARESYALLQRALVEENRVGIGTFVMRRTEYLAALRAMDGLILVAAMRFVDELVPASELDVGELPQPNEQELDLARKLIGAMDAPFEPERYHDRYRGRLRELIDRKAEGEEVVVPSPEEERGAATVVNLMDALKKSLEQTAKASASSKGAGRSKSKKRKSA